VARKKVVFMIVEGQTDETALSGIFSEIFDNDRVIVYVYRGDITSDNKVKPENIVKNISRIIEVCSMRYKLKDSDYARIIHITDTDGAYLPDECVKEDKRLTEIYYAPRGIKCRNRENIISRNERKRKNIDVLVEIKSIKKIPYGIYYMSRNLDHVLYNKANSRYKEKEADAYAFAEKYIGDSRGFLRFISCSDFSVTNGYLPSWEFIRHGTNSVQRYTNISLCFPDEKN